MRPGDSRIAAGDLPEAWRERVGYLSTPVDLGRLDAEQRIDDPYRLLALAVLYVALDDAVDGPLTREAVPWLVGQASVKNLWLAAAQVDAERLRWRWLRRVKELADRDEAEREALYARWGAEDARVPGLQA